MRLNQLLCVFTRAIAWRMQVQSAEWVSERCTTRIPLSLLCSFGEALLPPILPNARNLARVIAFGKDRSHRLPIEEKCWVEILEKASKEDGAHKTGPVDSFLTDGHTHTHTHTHT